MQLYIANCTRQVRQINFRLPEVSKNVQQTIPMLAQVRAGSPNLSRPDIDAIVEQLSRYGMVDIAKLGERKDPTQQIPYVCSVDKPVPASVITQVDKHNRGTLIMRGKRVREEAAIASSNFIEDNAPGTLRTLETTVQEEDSGTMTHERGEEPVNVGLRVEGSANPANSRRNGGRGNKSKKD